MRKIILSFTALKNLLEPAKCIGIKFYELSNILIYVKFLCPDHHLIKKLCTYIN